MPRLCPPSIHRLPTGKRLATLPDWATKVSVRSDSKWHMLAESTGSSCPASSATAANTTSGGTPRATSVATRRKAARLAGVFDQVREISHGIHPAILSERGLSPALRALARRSAVPVELDLRAGRQLPGPVEVAAYYAVSEALANAAKHAHASVVQVELDAPDAMVRVAIRDDGVGGADPARGSGLVGLRDRIEALGGTLQITSPAGTGTTLLIEIPAGGQDNPGAPKP